MSSEIAELVKALSIVQSKLAPAKKSEKNPFFHSTYSSLVDVWDNCRALLHENGFAVIQTTDYAVSPTGEAALVVITTLAHTSGQFISGTLRLKPVKDDPQSIGSAMSYGRRYGLAGIVGVVAEDEDDDAEGAMARKDNQPKYTKTPQKPLPSKPPMTAPQPSPTTPPKVAPLFPENNPEPAKEAPKQFGNTKPPIVEPEKADEPKANPKGAKEYVVTSQGGLIWASKHFFNKTSQDISATLNKQIPDTTEELKIAWATLVKAWS